MACCKDIIFTVSGGCPTNNNDPTPFSLVITQNILFQSITLTAAQANLGSVVTGPNLPIGSYRVDYLSGGLRWHDTNFGVVCIPEGGNAVGISTGTSGGGRELDVNLIEGNSPGPSIPLTIAGLQCSICGLDNSTCESTEPAREASTVALNPNPAFQVTSATFGNNYPIVATAWRADPTIGVGGTCTFTSGTLSYTLTQTQRFPELEPCVRIQNFNAVKLQIGDCGTIFQDQATYCAFPGSCVVPIQEWDGVFRFRQVFYPAVPEQQVNYFASNVGTSGGDTLEWTFLGKAMATTINYESAVQFRNDGTSSWWELRIICYLIVGYIQAVWVGRKTIGSTAIGTYTFDETAGCCAIGPATICVEPCPTENAIQKPTISTPQLLFGGAAYAPHP